VLKIVFGHNNSNDCPISAKFCKMKHGMPTILGLAMTVLYTSLFTKMVAHKKKIQTYKQKAV